MTMKEIITLNNVSIGYRQKSGSPIIVRENISLHAAKGELVALIGSNGIGKSTLLRTIAGLQPVIEGSIEVRGKSIDSYREKELALIMSFVSTEIIRASNLNVFDLISLGRYPHTNWSGILTDHDKYIVEEAIEMTGLKGYENKMINNISDGERQKTMIARTLAQDTDIIVLDEPTAFLDLSNKYEIVHILHKLANEKGKTILFSTHDLTTALAESDRLWLMLGDKVTEGAPEDLVLNGSFSSVFRNDHLLFDADRGDFRIKKEVIRKAVVKGTGTELTWTAKMLERTGFEVIQEKDADLSDPPLFVEISYPFWKLKEGGPEIEFDSLYDLARYIKEKASGLSDER